MLVLLAAAFAQAQDATPGVAGTPIASNLEYSVPAAGNWTYAPSADGSRATFTDSAGQPQLAVQCTRSTRRLALSKSASAASPTLWVWTSSQKKTLPATYDASAQRVTAVLGAFDPLLDAIASSRGRIGFSSSGLQALVVPPWADVARVIEDCRV